MVATVAGMTLYVSLEEPEATLVGSGFGISLSHFGALLAMPVGLLLGLLRWRLSRSQFLLVATVAGVASGILFGVWVADDGHFFSRSVVAPMACTWGIAAFGIAAFSSRSPNKSRERTRGR